MYKAQPLLPVKGAQQSLLNFGGLVKNEPKSFEEIMKSGYRWRKNYGKLIET